MLKRALLAALIAGLPSGASAQWIFKAEESAFGSSGNIVAFGANSFVALAFRCDNDEISAIFITPEEVDTKTAETFSVLNPKLLLRVDSEEIVELTSYPEARDGKLVVIAYVERPFLESVKESKKRVSVALKVGDKLFHEGAIPAAGSTKALTSFLDACSVGKEATAQ